MARSSIRLGWVVALALAGAGPTGSQTLVKELCPLGSGWEINPPYQQFHSGDPGIPLLKRTIDTTLYPNAVCNDGSPAVMYIRPAHANYGNNPINQPSNKWLIFLEGGGGCTNAERCLMERWCSGGPSPSPPPAPFDRAGKMSSLGAFNAIQSGGIFNLRPPAPFVNHFADYNHVFVHYCSSDNWIGSAEHKRVSAANGTNFDIRFEGEAIVDAVINTLLAGNVRADHPLEFLFYDTYLPSLRTASIILLGGESAGGVGLRHHLDSLRFDLESAALNPLVKIRGVVDAAFPPGEWDPAINWDDPNSPPRNYADFLKSIVSPQARTWWGADNSAVDESCLDVAHDAAHVADGGSHPEICHDTNYTLLNHIKTPVFIRMDIDDPLAKDKYLNWNLYPSIDDYWIAQYNQLALFRTYTAGSGGIEGPDSFPGIQGPNCGLHVVIQKKGFFDHRVVKPGLPQRSFHDLLVNWLTGAAGPGTNTQQIQEDNAVVGYTPSFCP